MKPVAQRLSKGNLGHDNLKNKQNESNNIPTKDVFANISKNKIKREIYLTFDDGLEAGTEEVLELLKEKKIKGTFFLIGKRIESMYKRNPYKCLELLKDIYENHAIGNHSYSHANEFYSSFYRDGGVVIKEEGSKKIRRTVVNDFIKAKSQLSLFRKEMRKLMVQIKKDSNFAIGVFKKYCCFDYSIINFLVAVLPSSLIFTM